MSKIKKICVITGSRAEYGLLKLIMKEISEAEDLTLQLIVTGSHLSKELGKTINEIKKDGFKVEFSADILGKNDSPKSVSISMSKVLKEFPSFYQTLNPDLILVLGDRYEIFASVASALIHKIPIAHIHGGELTEGAFDESLRHSITKMSHIHFTSSQEHKNRVIQLGEDPSYVFNVGAPGIEIIKKMKLLTKQEVEENLGIQLKDKFYLITFHPETLETSLSPEDQIDKLLEVLSEIKNTSFIFTKANADPGGLVINNKIQQFVKKHSSFASLHSSLGQLNYLSLMKYSDAVIGNSSSGIIEAPTLRKPVINIGNRQKGRSNSNAIIHCKNEKKSIISALNKLDSFDIDKQYDLQDGGNTSEQILNIIRDIDPRNILQKKFNNMEFPNV